MDQLDRLESKVDKLVEDFSEIKTHTAVNTVNLQEHMKRTEILEQQIVPINKTLNMLQGVVQFLSFAAVILTILEVLKYFKIF